MESVAQFIRRGLPWVAVPLLIASSLRLILEPGYWSYVYAGWIALILIFVAVHWLLLRRPSRVRIRLCLLVNFISITAGYQMIGFALRHPGGWRADALVFRVDDWIFAGDPQRLLQVIQAPWLSTVTMVGYLGFAGLLFYLFLSECVAAGEPAARLQLGLMRLYGVGFSGYLLLPACGPTFFHPSALPAIRHSALSARLQPWVLGNCSLVDACPSIHAAVCAFTLTWTFSQHRRLFWWLILPGAALLLGTVYLQYHYFTDIPFGLLLGFASAYSCLHAHSSSIPRSAGNLR